MSLVVSSFKSARSFFLDLGDPCGWGKFIWSSSIPPSKTLLWKVFHRRLPTDQHIQHRGLHICSMCTLCEKHENLFSIYFFNVPMLYIFGVGFNRSFLPLLSLIRMIFFLLLRVMIIFWLNWLILL